MNDKALEDLKVLIKKLGYGSLNVTYTVHNEQVRKVEVGGDAKRTYKKENDKALQDIKDRVMVPLERKDTTVVTFGVAIRDGEIEYVVWKSKIIKDYKA